MQNWLILDAMGVVFEVGDDVNDLLVPFLQRRWPDVDGALVNDVYRTASLGDITPEQFWQRLGLADEFPEVQEEYLATQQRLDPEFSRVLPELTARCRLAMLSNDIAEWSAFLRAKWGLDRHFDQVCISGECGLRKPDKKIYQLLLGRLEADASHCIFVDDRIKNLEPARDLGFETVLFVRPGGEDRDWLHSVTSFGDLVTLLDSFAARTPDAG